MHPIDNLFLENYKKLEQLCNPEYHPPQSVTNYINKCKQLLNEVTPEIRHDLQCFIDNATRCRDIRNQLAHKVLPDDQALSTEQDLRFIQRFTSAMIYGDDPIRDIAKRCGASVNTNAFQQGHQNIEDDDEDYDSYENDAYYCNPQPVYYDYSFKAKIKRIIEKVRNIAYWIGVALCGIFGLGLLIFILYILINVIWLAITWY